MTKSNSKDDLNLQNLNFLKYIYFSNFLERLKKANGSKVNKSKTRPDQTEIISSRGNMRQLNVKRHELKP